MARELDSAESAKIDDPVRLYLMEMGKVPLLSRDEEINLAKQIEQGRLEITAAIAKASATATEIKRAAHENRGWGFQPQRSSARQRGRKQCQPPGAQGERGSRGIRGDSCRI